MNKFQHLLASKMIRDHYSNMMNIAKSIIDKSNFDSSLLTLNDNFSGSNLFYDDNRYWITIIYSHHTGIRYNTGELYALIRNALNEYVKDNNLRIHISMEYDKYKTYCLRLFIHEKDIYYSSNR